MLSRSGASLCRLACPVACVWVLGSGAGPLGALAHLLRPLVALRMCSAGRGAGGVSVRSGGWDGGGAHAGPAVLVALVVVGGAGGSAYKAV